MGESANELRVASQVWLQHCTGHPSVLAVFAVCEGLKILSVLCSVLLAWSVPLLIATIHDGQPIVE